MEKENANMMNEKIIDESGSINAGSTQLCSTSRNSGGPPLIRVIRRQSRENMYAAWILFLTFLSYTCYHMTRKIISVVKSSLYTPNCTLALDNDQMLVSGNEIHSQPLIINGTKLVQSCPQWAPFNEQNGSHLLGILDVVFLFCYAVGVLVSGYVAERVNKRYFLSGGMLGISIFTAMMGVIYFAKIHSYAYFLIFQILNGFAQSTGWPTVVAIVSNWYGKSKRGFIMGVWNSHTSFGNMLGSVIPGLWAQGNWGWSFIVPAIITAVIAVLVFLTLVAAPDEVDCAKPRQNNERDQLLASAETAETITQEAPQTHKAITILEALRIEV
ncbi:uncharacterized protein TRIADDRAFT_60235 [Trichoplax adhaerens]|uniref:Major facilitator superfamily (MFS) profile domain-containing protein n=1 Tax=Trichoplax adhaerens TaxID=10228 RepID=B3S7N6_TRIAD|nr:hypothetical protein TRIADDRAFT_60235 [Trichoplax adhaerens]EDV21323.1 hypothetical protein TRIADDRAFT_60235 [Trichoplax adhaerens]|eukprot:XP_002116290.1 hypothetical protein TRIADDRAFT_60235 [Trichoplax adhaerens]